MKQVITINNRRIKLDAAQLIQAGGEGMVFDLGDTAVKLYHHPTDRHQAKLNHLFSQRWPDGVLGPTHPVHNGSSQLIGFQMSKLPADSHPIKQLSNPVYCKKNNIHTPAVLALLIHVHQTLSTLHQNKIIVGDLNDTNIFFTPSPHHPFIPFWIDVDSYQLAGFPCPVAMESFLDPALYAITDFSYTPVFSQSTDWYAFAVLLTKSLLQAHPYGGTHHQYQSLRARAEARVSVFNTAVTYPSRALPAETAPDDLLHELHLIFEQGHRRPFSLNALVDYANSLAACPDCGLVYTTQRTGCPACRHPIPVPQQLSAGDSQTLFEVDGFIEHVALRPDGRFWVVTRSGSQYRLILAGIGGKVSDIPLFTGAPGYRFGLFGNTLVVNPPQRPHLLLLDVSSSQPKQLTMIETTLFRNTAVFATTPQHLYRTAGAWIMQGSSQNGHYVEDAVATAHRNQTQFWASPYNDTIAGYHRIFAEHRFFLHNWQGNELDLKIPPLDAGEYIAETAVAFAPRQLALILKIGQKKQVRPEIHTFTDQGEWVRQEQLAEDEWETAVLTYPYFRQQTPQGKLYQLPQGLLISNIHKLSIRYSK